MSENEILIDRILSASGIVGRDRRRDIEREMRAHIEDIIEEERSAGRDEREIERSVALRFGVPDEIGHEFAAVYRSQRIVFSLLSYSLLAVTSVAVVAAFVYAIQYSVVLWVGASTASIFTRSHLQPESAVIIGLTLGYLSLYFAERLFVQYRFAKALGLVGIIFGLAGASLNLAGLGCAGPLLTGFLFAIVVRLLERIVAHNRLRLAGLLVLFAVIGRLAPCFVVCSKQAPTWLLLLPVCLAIAISSQFVGYFAGLFDRQILKRHLA
jgi:hypothetical protein